MTKSELKEIIKECILEEAANDSLDLSSYKININGREYPIRFIFNGYSKDYIKEGFNEKELKKRIESILKNKPWNNSQIYKNYFEMYSHLWEDINNDPYFDGKKISNPADILKSLEPKFTLEICNKNSYYKNEFFVLLGECWWDEEHGFSMVFPNDKFVKVTNIRNNNKPTESFLGSHSDWY